MSHRGLTILFGALCALDFVLAVTGAIWPVTWVAFGISLVMLPVNAYLWGRDA